MTPSAANKAYNKAVKAGKRLPELEHIIMNDPWHSCLYAERVIKARWIEAEDIIMTDPESSYYCAIHVIKGHLPTKMHNRMLFYAMENPNDGWVKRYFKFIERRENWVKEFISRNQNDTTRSIR